MCILHLLSSALHHILSSFLFLFSSSLQDILSISFVSLCVWILYISSCRVCWCV
jgi:hypothetical protein